MQLFGQEYEIKKYLKFQNRGRNQRQTWLSATFKLPFMLSTYSNYAEYLYICIYISQKFYQQDNCGIRISLYSFGIKQRQVILFKTVSKTMYQRGFDKVDLSALLSYKTKTFPWETMRGFYSGMRCKMQI